MSRLCLLNARLLIASVQLEARSGVRGGQGIDDQGGCQNAGSGADAQGGRMNRLQASNVYTKTEDMLHDTIIGGALPRLNVSYSVDRTWSSIMSHGSSRGL